MTLKHGDFFQYGKDVLGAVDAVYDYSQMGGPLFSVLGHMIEHYSGDLFDIELLADNAISGPLGDRCNGQEQA